MGGGLLQLVAYGAQDIFLTGNPNITYFKSVYRKYTNFSIEAIIQTFEEGSPLKNTTTGTLIISRNGDLVSKIWVEAYFPKVVSSSGKSPTFTSWCNNTGHAYIQECTLRIGGSEIDKHDSRYLDINNEFTDIDEKQHMGLNKHQNNLYMTSGISNTAPELQLIIPLQFYFNRNYGYALPLIALQYHEVEIKFTFRKLQTLIVSDKNVLEADIEDPTTNVWAEYIFLDTAERKRFAQTSHEYLIEQVQHETFNSVEKQNTLKFNHPVKQLIWCFVNDTRETDINMTVNDNEANPSVFVPKKFNDSGTLITGTETIGGNDYFNYQVNSTNTHNISGQNSGACIYLNKNLDHFDTATIKFNSSERFEAQKAIFFRYLQPLNHNARIPKKTIYTYNFALKANQYEPSGTCNFSRIPEAMLAFNNIGDDDTSRNLHVYAINYNILSISSGQAGLKFAN
jgi:hypothetical protein